MEDGHPPKARTGATTSTTDPATIIQPARSRTDPSSTASDKAEKHHHLPRRLHANSLLGRDRDRTNNNNSTSSNHHHSIRHGAKDTVQSAIELKPPISFEHFLRRERKKGSPDSSRRGSQQAHNQVGGNIDGAAEHDPQAAIEAQRARRARVKPQHVEREKRRNEKRERELKDSLRALEELGMQSTRQLDDTYYMILEKASILRSTVASLQQLADQSVRMHSTFKNNTEDLEKETNAAIDGWGDFDQQERSVDELVGKLKDSKTTSEKLNDRLDKARQRIEAYDRRQNIGQAKSRTRWRVIYAGLMGLVVLMIALLVAKHRRHVGGTIGSLGGIADSIPNNLLPKMRPAEDPYLQKLFDDL